MQFLKNYVNCEKTQRYYTCHNRKQNELFSTRTKSSCFKFFYRKVISKSLVVYIKTDYIYEDIAEDVQSRFETSNYELDRPLFKGKTKKVIGLMKNELRGKIMIKFVGLSA